MRKTFVRWHTSIAAPASVDGPTSASLHELPLPAVEVGVAGPGDEDGDREGAEIDPPLHIDGRLALKLVREPLWRSRLEQAVSKAGYHRSNRIQHVELEQPRMLDHGPRVADDIRSNQDRKHEVDQAEKRLQYELNVLIKHVQRRAPEGASQDQQELGGNDQREPDDGRK